MHRRIVNPWIVYHELQSVTKYLKLTLAFMKNRAPWEKFNRHFSKKFLLVLAKFLF